MGIKAKTTAILISLFCISFTYTVYAASVDDLYEHYDIPYVQDYPEGVTDTIRDYNNAHRFYNMYNCVVNVEYDVTTINDKIKEKEDELVAIEKQLQNGYDLSLSEIFTLEDKYVSVKADIQALRKCGESYDIPLEKNYNSVPTRGEFEEALQIKQTVDKQCDLGELIRDIPVESPTLLSAKKPTSLEVAVENGSNVYSLYNGTVSHVGSDYVGINHNYGVYTYYGKLSSISVNIGDTITPETVIGKSTNKLLLKLKLGDKLVDISRIFKEVD